MRYFDQSSLDEAAKLLKNHGSLLVPTDTVYGISALYGDPEDLNMIKNIKKRPEEKPVPFVVSSVSMMEQIAKVNQMAKKLAEKLLPGALTLICPLQDGVDPVFTNGKNTIAVRIVDHPLLLALIDKAGSPLLLTSANLSGEPAATDARTAMEVLGHADGILEGECRAKMASTIVDCTKEQPVILRQGPITMEEIEAALAS